MTVIRVAVLCFAQTREITGSPALALELPEGARVTALLEALHAAHPGLAAVTLRIAVNREFAAADHALRDGDEVALIPPVAGG